MRDGRVLEGQKLTRSRGTEVDESQSETQSPGFLEGHGGGRFVGRKCILSVMIPLHQMRRNMDEYPHLQVRVQRCGPVDSTYKIPLEVVRSHMRENTGHGSSEPDFEHRNVLCTFSFVKHMSQVFHSHF